MPKFATSQTSVALYPGINADAALFAKVWIFVCVLSVIGSLAILATGYAFPSMVKNKIYMQMILVLSVSNLFAALVGFWGYPTDALTCQVQGGFAQTFYRVSWLWVVFLSSQLTTCLKFGQNMFTLKQMTIITVVAVGVVEIISAIFKLKYGLAPNVRGYFVCSYDTTSNNGDEIVFANFFMPMYICVAFLVFNALKLHNFVKEIEGTLAPEKMKMVLLLRDSCNSYPIVTILCWGPVSLYTLILVISQATRPDGESYSNEQLATAYRLQNSFLCLGGLEGLLNAAVFFKYGKEARKRWRALLTQYAFGKFILEHCFQWFGVGGTLDWHLNKDKRADELKTKKEELDMNYDSSDYDSSDEEGGSTRAASESVTSAVGSMKKTKSMNRKSGKGKSTKRSRKSSKESASNRSSRSLDNENENNNDNIPDSGDFSDRDSSFNYDDAAFLDGARDFTTDEEIVNIMHESRKHEKSLKGPGQVGNANIGKGDNLNNNHNGAGLEMELAAL